jgi:hypothetical protein
LCRRGRHRLGVHPRRHRRHPLFAAIVATAIARSLPARGVAVGMAIPSLGEGRSSASGVGLIVAAMVSYGQGAWRGNRMVKNLEPGTCSSAAFRSRP